MENKAYIKVILPLKLGWEPFYALPSSAGGDSAAAVGDRVLLRFAGRHYLGVVSAVDANPSAEGVKESSIKEIYGVDSAKDRISATEIEFWRRLSDYYMCTVGEVYKAAYPSVKDELVRPRKTEEAYVPMAETYPAAAAVLWESHDSRGRKDCQCPLESDISRQHSGKPVLLQCGNAEDILLATCVAHRHRNILWLVPEVKFNKALEKKVRSVAGSRLIVWGSNITSAKKREAARRVRSGEPYLILGTRSSLFLPHRDLGLVIVQEEQEASYKQTSPAPRYNGRDAAVILASIHGASVVLQSSTPSFETLHNVRSGKYELAASAQPEQGRTECLIIDTSAERRKNGMVGELSKKLLESVGQSRCPAFYKPRRAMFPKMEELLPQIGRQCGPSVFVTEDIVENPLPEACDTLVLMGADSMLGKQDFRADERLIQTVRQAAAQCQGCLRTIVVQTKEASHPVFEALASGNVDSLLAERHQFGYPPFTRIVDICIRDDFKERAQRLSRKLLGSVNNIGIGQAIPMGDERIRIVLAKDRMLTGRKATLQSLVDAFEKENKYPGHIYFDVDPQ